MVNARAKFPVPHDPYEGLKRSERDFMTELRDWLRATYPGGVPMSLEVTNGVCRERLTLDPDIGEVFCLPKKPKGAGHRTVEAYIMPHAEAKECAVRPSFPEPGWPHSGATGETGAATTTRASGSYGAKETDSTTSSPFVDPCCWWEWNGSDWVCVAYGN